MADVKEEGQGAWSKVPTWDGSPLTWRSFRREMSWWISSLDLEATRKYNLAARWLLRQSGIVRQRGEEFDPDELQYKKATELKDPQTGEVLVDEPEDLLFGLNKLLGALENMNGLSVLDKRGELRSQFYLQLSRRAGERVTDYASRFRTSVADLKAEGVVLPDGEIGWWFKEKLGLDALRRQLLDTALQGSESYAVIEAECLRLFRDLHSQDPLFRKLDRSVGPKLTVRRMFGQSSAVSSAGSSFSRRTASTAPSSSASSVALPGPRRPPPRQVHETEAAEEEANVEAEHPAEDEDEAPERGLEEVLQAEVEVLTDEIAAAEEEGVDPSHLEALEQGIEASAEALVSMREARTRLAEVRKDRGFRGPGVGGGLPKAKAKTSLAISQKKASGRHLCFDCGGSGHWAGDPECPRPGAGAGRPKARANPKQVRITEAVVSNEASAVENPGAENEVNMIALVPRYEVRQCMLATHFL